MSSTRDDRRQPARADPDPQRLDQDRAADERSGRAASPAWAADWGRDQFGAWATFRVGGVTPEAALDSPGRFLMGSPRDEEGRYDDEGPQHEVTIERGFWLFDTPCTQALWEAVMGAESEPVPDSHAAGRESELGRCPGVRDAHGRAGSTGCSSRCRRRRSGSTPAGGNHDGPVWHDGSLSEIAWYCREQRWRETHPVGQKLPNGWGLYDMLGNVWEWCRGRVSGAYRRRASTAASADRVIRGGSWLDDARYVRAASRARVRPGLPERRPRLSLCRVQESRSSQPGRASGESVGAWGGAPRRRRASEREPVAGPGWPRARTRLAFPAVVPVRVLSDLDELTIRTLTRPAWARDIGRDSYGLWAELRIGESVPPAPALDSAGPVPDGLARG